MKKILAFMVVSIHAMAAPCKHCPHRKTDLPIKAPISVDDSRTSLAVGHRVKLLHAIQNLPRHGYVPKGSTGKVFAIDNVNRLVIVRMDGGFYIPFDADCTSHAISVVKSKP